MCGHTYIGRSNRDLKIRVGEHVPKWLQKQIQSNDPIRVEDKHPSSSIAKHIIETGHKIDLNSAFVVLFKSVKEGRILRFIEGLAIRKFKQLIGHIAVPTVIFVLVHNTDRIRVIDLSTESFA